MGISVINYIMATLLLFVMPVFVGNTVTGVFDLKRSLSKSFVYGLITIWAFCQIISVPLILLKQSFLIVFFALLTFEIVVSIYGIYKKYTVKVVPRLSGISTVIAVLFACGAIFVLIFLNCYFQHLDEDDSRFVVNAVDIVRTNKMFLVNPATGEYEGTWVGELAKDITSPWAVYIAFLSKACGIPVAVMAHTFMPVMLLLAVCAVFWLLSEEFFAEDIVSRGIFEGILIFLCAYGDYSRRSAHRFMMVRIWQGKAIVACFGIPLLFLLAMRIFKDKDRRGNYFIMCLLGLALCLMSGMGIIISVIMLGCIGVVYGIYYKNIRYMLAMWVTAVPSLLFCGLNFLVG